MNYRKIWEQNYGSIPRDEYGFSYEIHHIDGNRNNNNIDNLKLVTIHEHLDIHYKQGDWGAVALIAKRIGLGSNYVSSIQKGKKRPGIGGVKKGNTPWNKGKKKCFTEKTISNMKKKRKGRIFGKVKISESLKEEILKIYDSKPKLNGVGEIQQNGKILTYDHAFSKEYSSKYKVVPLTIKNIIKRERHVNKK